MSFHALARLAPNSKSLSFLTCSVKHIYLWKPGVSTRGRQLPCEKRPAYLWTPASLGSKRVEQWYKQEVKRGKKLSLLYSFIPEVNSFIWSLGCLFWSVTLFFLGVSRDEITPHKKFVSLAKSRTLRRITTIMSACILSEISASLFAKCSFLSVKSYVPIW